MTAEHFTTHVVMDGAVVPRSEARVGIESPAFRYGAMVFEGLRVYLDGAGQPNLFRPTDHLRRLQDSMRTLKFLPIPEVDELQAMLTSSLVQLKVDVDAHVRFMVYVAGDGPMWSSGPLGTAIVVNGIRSELPEGREVTAAVTSWRRIDDASMPPRVKSAANYQNSRLGVLDARQRGADVALFLDRDGKLTESHGSCILIVRNGRVVTPPVTSGILESVTRDTVIELLRDEGIEVTERMIDRTELGNADEVLLCGSMAEVTRVTMVDGWELPRPAVSIGSLAAARYEDAVRARSPHSAQWCVPLEAAS